MTRFDCCSQIKKFIIEVCLPLSVRNRRSGHNYAGENAV